MTSKFFNKIKTSLKSLSDVLRSTQLFVVITSYCGGASGKYQARGLEGDLFGTPDPHGNTRIPDEVILYRAKFLSALSHCAMILLFASHLKILNYAQLFLVLVVRKSFLVRFPECTWPLSQLKKLLRLPCILQFYWLNIRNIHENVLFFFKGPN